MRPALKNLMVKLLEELTEKIKTETCEMTEEEVSDVASAILHIAVSKEEACNHLKCSRATFDNAVRDGRIPPGRKRRFRKELVWYKDELSNILKR